MKKRNQSYSPVKKQGLLKYAWSLFRRITRKTIGLDWESEIFLERSLAEPVQEIEPKIKVQIVQANEDDLGKFKGIVDEAKYNRFRQRFRKGRICFMALDGKKAAAFAWISFGDEYDPVGEIEIKLNEGEGYLFDYLVSEEYRQRGIYTSLLTETLVYLQHKGYRTARTLIGSSNIPVRKALRKFGFQSVRAVTLIRIFGLKFHRWQKYTGPL